MDRRSRNAGSRLLKQIGVSSMGGAGGQRRERALGRDGVASRNQFLSPAQAQHRERTLTAQISPSFTTRSCHGNRSISAEQQLEDDSAEQEGVAVDSRGVHSGRRLIDIEQLESFVLEHCSCKQCSQPMYYIGESRSGLASCFKFQCLHGHTCQWWSSRDAAGTAPAAAGQKAVNLAAAAGTMSIGIGADAAELLLGGFLDVPIPAKWAASLYRKYEDRVGTAYTAEGKRLADRTLSLEKEMTLQAYDDGRLGRELYEVIDGEEFMVLDVMVDGGWQVSELSVLICPPPSTFPPVTPTGCPTYLLPYFPYYPLLDASPTCYRIFPTSPYWIPLHM